jgi:hypothetical protein
MVALGLGLALGAGMGFAQGPGPGRDSEIQTAPVGPAFTYQGRLSDAGDPANGTYDLEFRLYDAVSGGVQVSSTVSREHVAVTDGVFTVELDFGGGAFTGDARWLEIGVREGSSTGPYTPLAPRQAFTAAPYALHALRAPWSGLAGVPGGFADGVDNDTTYTPGTGLNLDGAQFSVVPEYRLPQGCADGQIAEWSGGVWVCADDDGGSAGWSLGGNAGTTPGTNYVGTSDSAALELKVNGARALRLEPGSSPNLIGGYSGNTVTAGVTGVAIGGGGGAGNANRVTDGWGTVAGGANNRAGDDSGTVDSARFATVGGGIGNYAGKESATVAGGYSNQVIGAYGTVGGGEQNHANGERSTVAGGSSNEAIGPYAAVGGGKDNTVSGNYASVGGGWSNAASAQYAAIGGGYDNTASNEYTTVSGGSTNTASHLDATVAGGSHNTASGPRAAVGGGYGNTASAQNATVGGGWQNTASEQDATVGGGQWNTAAAGFATISGGGPTDLDSPQTTSNLVTDMYGTVGGGGDNRAGADDGDPNSQVYATVGGGASNRALGDYATVGGGLDNLAHAVYATVGGGHENTANGMNASVGGGETNYAIGDVSTVSGGLNNWARGHGAMVPGGYGNRALGNYSLTAGFQAVANNEGCFVWGDKTSGEISCNNNNRWVARTSGGVYFYTNSTLSSGVYVSAGGNSWNGVSDRAVKENFSPADGQALLETLASLPVQEYNLKSQDSAIRHIGLVAQDFAAFGYGESDTAINMQDADGVALAAIQRLYAQNQELAADHAALRQRVGDLEARVAALETAVTSRPAEPVARGVGLLPGIGVLLTGVTIPWVFRRERIPRRFEGGRG